ncbi:MAG: DNA replication and repair protein RecF [Chloroflexota bacterium]|nr:DNA replication and repair protein RecF [Chloroflexota bacterium]
MYLTHFSLTNFRNFTRLDIDVPSGTLLVVGDNAQGKTSLLEAIYFISAFTSYQASHNRELLNFIAAREQLTVGRIVADYRRGEKSHRLEVRIIQERSGNGNTRVRKEVLLNDVKGNISETIGHFNAVLFLPRMLSIIDGSPSERRHYLNLAISQTSSRYTAAFSAYNKAITQRNALLKMLAERGGDTGQLDYWDEKITQSGATIIRARIHAIREIEHLAALIHHELTRGKEVLRLIYRPAYDPYTPPKNQIELPLDAPIDRTGFSKEEIAAGFLQALIALRKEEIRRGVTTIGPHRDELHFLSNGIDLGTYGSRGQIRTTLLALKIAEVAWIKEKTGYWPLLLLDEVLAELDNQRRVDLLERLTEIEQALLTTTDLNLFTPDFVQAATTWQIRGGRLVSGD